MFIEKKMMPNHNTKKSMWYGVSIIVYDFMLWTTLISPVYIDEPLKFIISIVYDILSGLIKFTIVVFIIGMFIYIIVLLKRLYKNYKPHLIKSAIYAVIAYAVYLIFLVDFIAWVDRFEIFKSDIFFFMPVIRRMGPIVIYLILLASITVISYARDNYVKFNRVFHLTFVLMIGYFIFYALFAFIGIYFKIDVILPGESISILPIGIYALTIFGIWLTVLSRLIIKYNEDVTFGVIYAYKAIIVSVCILRIVFLVIG
jgi:hypothetical protein